MRLTVIFALTSILLVGCNDAYRKENALAWPVLGVMDVVTGGEFSELMVCQEKYGENDSRCVEIDRKAKANFKYIVTDTARDSLNQAYGVNSSSNGVDYSHDWDYLPENGMWVCRGIQTGQFSEYENCSGLIQTDARWPD